jgi:cytidylate kinase
LDEDRIENRCIVLAVDGPAGSGKSTTAAEIARQLGWIYLETGAMYRAVALAVLERGIDTMDEEAVSELAEKVEIDFVTDDGTRVLLDGCDVTDRIREHDVSGIVSEISAMPRVRSAMVERQREIAGSRNAVVEGRDIGSVVFPDADLKIYLTASVEERAGRRLKQLRRAGIDADLEETKRDIENRDRLDSTREHSPLMQAEDAVIIDTTSLTFDEQVQKIMSLLSRFSGSQ